MLFRKTNQDETFPRFSVSLNVNEMRVNLKTAKPRKGVNVFLEDQVCIVTTVITLSACVAVALKKARIHLKQFYSNQMK